MAEALTDWMDCDDATRRDIGRRARRRAESFDIAHVSEQALDRFHLVAREARA